MKIHNYSKNTLAMPYRDEHGAVVLRPGETRELTKEQQKKCGDDHGFQHWAKHKCVGPPPELEPDDPAPGPQAGDDGGKGKASAAAKG